MKIVLKGISGLFVILLVSCGSGDKKKEEDQIKLTKKETTTKKAEEQQTTKASETIDLVSKGVGPIKELKLPEEIDQDMVAQGKMVYDGMCTMCHMVDKKFVGPPINNILERRTPEWIMNMILNPEVMLKEDELAKKLLVEFNNTVMINQYISKEDARAIVEYLRVLK